MTINDVQFSIAITGFDSQDKKNRRTLEDTLTDFNFNYFGLPVKSYSPVVSFDFGDLPSMIGQSEDEHAQLSVSAKNIQLLVSYDANFFSNRQKYFDYIQKYTSLVAKILEETNATYIYSGFIARYFSENLNDAINLLNRDSIKVVSEQPFSNFLKKFAVIYAEKYYVNFELVTLRNEEGGNHNICISVDINDRYSSEITNAPVGYENINLMKNLCEKISEVTLQNLLLSGELNLNE